MRGLVALSLSIAFKSRGNACSDFLNSKIVGIT
jgi:hypothetical protein